MPDIVYGGPYANEADAITKESLKENPDFAELTKDWKTISQGAKDYIEQVQKPVEKREGVFISNYVEDEKEEVEVPAVVPFITPDEVVTDPDATVETEPETEAPVEEETPVEEEQTVSEEEQAEFDKELGL